MKELFDKALKTQKEKNLYRQLVESNVVDSVTIKRGKKNFISFCSNDYFGLSQNSSLKKVASSTINKYGVGAGASRYVTGNNFLYKKLERQIACMKNCEDAIVFSSGYVCAIGVIPALVSKSDLIIMDRLIHSSLIDGVKLSGAYFIRFLHNDIAHARKILEKNRYKFKKCLIVTETVFSMDGDSGEVSELLKLASEFDCILISDAAHDLFLQKNSPAKNHLQIGTLSKAVGAVGGYVAGDKILIEYLRNFAKSQIYSTALPPSILAVCVASLKIIEKRKLGEKVLKNAQYFCDLVKLPKPQSAIIPIILGDNKKVLLIAKKVEQQGILISAIRPPTVESGKARLRITFSSQHKKHQIKKLAQLITKLVF